MILFRYSAAGYAAKEGHTDLAERLGGLGSSPMNPGGGIWTRKWDPTQGMGYYENDITGESWWETEALASHEREQLPPNVLDWLRQQELRTEIVGILTDNDPIRLAEIDQLVEGAGGTQGLEQLCSELRSYYQAAADATTTNGAAATEERDSMMEEKFTWLTMLWI